MIENKELQLAEDFVLYTKQNIFLTGKAGTGKTTFLRSLANKSQKRMIVTAPTGVAAINARGVTLHSFFQLPFGPLITEQVAGRKVENQMFKHKFSKDKINIIKTLDLLIIDEVSMVRADILDAVDEVLRHFKNRFLPFGGVQLLMIGDIQQLPPVIKNEEFQLLKPYYSSMYFFNSKALSEANMISIELKHIYRQKDNKFIKILNEIRDNSLTESSYQQLHERYIHDFKPDDKDGYITLTTHNHTARTINKTRLSQIEGKLYKFQAVINGTFSEFAFPNDFELELKIGAQVMFIRNDSSHEKRYFNGKIGIITEIDNDIIMVKSENEYLEIATSPEKWENIKYSLNEKNNEIVEEVIGTFIQYPLKLAWAVTIHKSQGLTFEKAIIDSSDAFAYGQTYVALSRCKSLEGLVLSSKISKNAVIGDNEVCNFNQNIEKNQPGDDDLEKAKSAYQMELINELFNYKQLNYSFERLEKTLNEHFNTFTGTLKLNVNEIKKNVLLEITNIANNFLKQIKMFTTEKQKIEDNKIVQERLKKAGEYFIDVHAEKIIKKLEVSSFETDNKEIGKSIKTHLSEINEILNVKQQCLIVCRNGFKVEKYIEARTKSMFEYKEKTKKTNKTEKNTETKHSDLYSTLKTWRTKTSELNDIEPYMILLNKTMQIIANQLPTTLNQLKSVSGIGKKKIMLFGKEILEIITNYIETNHFEKDKDMIEIPETSKILKKKTGEISYEMYKEGKSIQEIAHLQGFTISTIENHLGTYIASGQIKIEELLDSMSIIEIKKYFETAPKKSLTEAKKALPEHYTWSQLKFVKNHIEYSTGSKL